MAGHINPHIIHWARLRSGLSIEELARQMRKDPDELRDWETGVTVPSYASLEKLAYRHLKIPLAVFYFPEPPELDDPVSKLRRLPKHELERISHHTLQMIRLAQGYQESLTELAKDSISAQRIFLELSSAERSSVELACQARAYLGITIEQQFTFRSTELALKTWRHALEQAGIFTFKDSLKDDFISGFCLLDDDFPIIFLNNSNAFSRQLFTLAHELGHILFRVNGITDIDDSYLRYMTGDDRLVEVRCNEFAAELLVPERAFRADSLVRRVGPEGVSDIASKFSVSREVILRRFLDCGLMTREDYMERAKEWNEEYLRGRKKKGGNFYLTRLAYVGEGFARLAFGKYRSRRIDRVQLATHLNVRARFLDRLARYVGA